MANLLAARDRRRDYANQFAYRTFRPDMPRETRLLTIHPGRFGETPTVSLRHVDLDSLDQLPKYEALSYAWGTMDNPQVIHVRYADTDAGQGGYIEVTESLDTALRHLRQILEPRIMWIDAICINQNDERERGHQVAWMGEIFRRAHRVVAFLGEPSDGSSYALRNLHELGSSVTYYWENDYLVVLPNARRIEPPPAYNRPYRLFYNPEEFSRIMDLFRRSWFERVWIRQEIQLAREAILQCGGATIEWPIFSNAVVCFNKGQVHPISPMQEISSEYFKRRAMLLQLCTPGTRYRLDRLLEELQDCKCYDLRDRMYGVLSLLCATDQALQIVPDYIRDVSDVYKDATLSLIHSNRCLRMIGMCRLRRASSTYLSTQSSWYSAPSSAYTKSSPAHFPTWVPDARDMERPKPLYFGFASGRLPAVAEVLEDAKTLRVGGISISTVTSTFLRRMSTLSWLQRIATRFDLQSSYICGRKSRLDALLEAVLPRFSDYYNPPEPQLPRQQQVKIAALRLLSETHTQSSILGPDIHMSWENFLRRVSLYVANRVFFTTEAGHMGIGPTSMESGDILCVLFGHDYPVCLRPVNGSFWVVGHCWVSGLMCGEAVMGQLPDNIDLIWNKTNARSQREIRFKDRMSLPENALHSEDPRWDNFTPAARSVILALREDNRPVQARIESLNHEGIAAAQFDLV
jgi:hypothetical protein